MERASSIVIYKRGGSNFYADATGKFGGGYSGAFAGKTTEEAAIFAIREQGRYSDALIIAPKEVQEHIDAFLSK